MVVRCSTSVSVPLVSPKLLKTKRWYVEGKCKSTISPFLIGQNVKWLCFCVVRDLLSRLVGGDADPCKGYPVYSRLISTLVFHLYHERDSDAQEILLALLSKLSLLRCAGYYMKAWPDLPTCSVYYYTRRIQHIVGRAFTRAAISATPTV